MVTGKGPDARRVAGRTGNIEAYTQSGFVSNSWLLPMLEFGPLGVLGIVGLFWASWRLARDRWALGVLAVLAWIMLCDNAVHAVHFGMAIRTLGLLAGPLSAMMSAEAYPAAEGYVFVDAAGTAYQVLPGAYGGYAE